MLLFFSSTPYTFPCESKFSSNVINHLNNKLLTFIDSKLQTDYMVWGACNQNFANKVYNYFRQLKG